MGDTKFRQNGRRTAKGPFRTELKELRRKQGEERNAAWQALSTAAKITSLQQRRGESRRQLRKLGVDL